MRINNYFLDNSIFIDKNILKQGSIFKGQILDIFHDEVLMQIKEYGVLRATIDTKVEININDEITFLVQSSKEDEIKIKPLFIKDSEGVNIKEGNNKNNLLSKLLANINNKNLNIKDNTLSSELVKNLMENNIKLNEENLINSIKLLDKLIDLSYLNDDKKVIFIDGENENQRNPNYKLNLGNNTKNNTNKSDVIKKEAVIPHKAHIKHLLITDKNTYNNKEDLSLIVKKFLFENEDMKLGDLPKIISFIMKNNIKPSLNNIKNIRELNSNPEVFLKSFSTVKEGFNKFLYDNDVKNNVDKKDLTSQIKLLQEDIEKNQGLEINGFKKLEKIIEEIEYLKNYDIEDEVSLFKDKIDFLKELNKDLSFMFIPINYEPGALEGALSFLKRKNKKTNNGKINVFISLNTKVLGDIKISCELYMKSINVKMNINKNDLGLFKSKKDILIKKIKEIGYDLNNIEYEFNENLKLIDQIVVSDNTTYFLDIKV